MLGYRRLTVLISGFNRRRYSGQDTNGKKCLAVMTENQTALQLLADIICNCEDECEAAALLREAQIYSWGQETVIYWPNVLVPTPQESRRGFSLT
jgi:hypothetical protein